MITRNPFVMLPPRLALPVVVAALIATLVLCLPLGGYRKADNPSGAAGVDGVQAVAVQPSARPRGQAAVWLPLLDDTTRAVLTAFPSVSNEADGVADPERLSPGPLLLPADNGDAPAAAGSGLSSDTSSATGNIASSAPPIVSWGPQTTVEMPAGSGAGASATGPDGLSAAVAPRQAAPTVGSQSLTVEVDAGAVPAEEPPALLPVTAGQQRSWQLELIAREADAHSQLAFELAGREAFFSARAELIMALRLVAQGLDAEVQAGSHSRALAAGMTALKEAEDFIPRGSQLEADLDLAATVQGHRTPVLKDTDKSSLTPLLALQCYLTFAQQQLAAACDQEIAGSMALVGLGKLYATAAGRGQLILKAAEPKAMAFYQAALLVWPENHVASNELGVLLAKGGRFEDARVALEHSVSMKRDAIGLHNLAAVYRQMGWKDRAATVDAESARLARSEGVAVGAATASVPPVQWVDVATFQQSGESAQGTSAPASAASTTKAPTSPAPAQRSDGGRRAQSLWNWFK